MCIYVYYALQNAHRDPLRPWVCNAGLQSWHATWGTRTSVLTHVHFGAAVEPLDTSEMCFLLRAAELWLRRGLGSRTKRGRK